MTTRIDPNTAAPDVRRWAAEEFQLARGATRADLRGAFCRRLRDEKFLPPISSRVAFQLLSRLPQEAGQPPRADDPAFWAFESWVRNQIAQLAIDYFTLPPALRKQRFVELKQACSGHPRLEHRLALLEPGLKLGREALEDESLQVRELAEVAFRMFVLRPRARAVVRQEFLHKISDQDRALWKNAVRRMKNFYPGVVKISEDLMSAISPMGAAPAAPAKFRPGSGVASTLDFATTPSRSIARPMQPNSAGNYGFIFLIVIALSIMGRIVATLNRGAPPAESTRETDRAMRLLEELRRESAKQKNPADPNAPPKLPTSPFIKPSISAPPTPGTSTPSAPTPSAPTPGGSAVPSPRRPGAP